MDAAARASAAAFPAAPSTSAAASAAPPPLAPSLPTPPPAAAVAPSSSAAVSLQKEPAPSGGDQRLRFSVTLKPGETTIVSWKRLLKENGKGQGDPPVAGPADRPPAAQPGEVAAPSAEDPKDAVPPPNRFSAVIEKIERLYVGNESSDEELDDIPDDDQYDTEDSFIDDTELDEYFQVDKMSTKHNGYFVNKGKLEQIESSLSPKEVPKKRRRKDTPKLHGDGSHAIVSDNPPNAGNVRAKDAARSGSVVGRKLNPAKVYASYGGHYNEEGRSLKYRSKATTAVSKRKSADFTMPEEQSTMRLPYKDILSTPSELKDFDKHKAGAGATHRSRTSDSLDQAFRDKVQVDFHSKKLHNGETREASTKVRRVDRYSTSDAFSMNSPGSSYPVHSTQSSSRAREGSSVRPKGTTLERAIRDLEMIVAECRPPTLVVQDADPAFQSIKRRLPQPVKQKLAKVARLSASQGKISEDELVDRLMGILGHLMQRKTLKKNMRTMVEVGNSAKQQKADRFQQIKREVNEMVRARVSQLRPQLAEQQEGSSIDFKEINNDEKRALKGKYSMDSALEDKICELYDLYVEGMDEDKGPQSRKLYLELAELWPNGYMDNVGIKDAIYRSKERKRALYRHHKVRDEERIKRKKLASAMRADESNPASASQLRSVQERTPPATDSAAKYLPPTKLVPNQVVSSTSAFVDSAQPYTDPIQPVSKNPDKTRGVDMRTNPEDAKKKLKRKVESESSETRGHPERLPSQHVTEKQKSFKHMDDTNASNQPKLNLLESSGVPNLDQAS
ncbi:ubinuclein-1-like isoform X2 [Zingiber officinale]|uniref:ubinuclein-1-like isoform X2 n=1 Tax=Zingiber officinale TaxID=94328 RepID=UPI001C4AAC03|nr:ubinuclein-1-like isoform X2 [Zingiber officinale]